MQGKDNLEKFVSENREEFNDRTPQRRSCESLSSSPTGTGRPVVKI